MKRPEVTLENHEAVYDFYDKYEPSARAQRAAHLILSLLYHPRVAFAEGAEAQIEAAAKNDTRLFIVANHVRAQDPLLFGPALRRSEALKHYNGRTFEPAKPRLFQTSGLRHTIDVLGAVPAFRDKDAAGDTGDNRLGATMGYLRVTSDKIIRGRSMIVHAEGTRNKGDPHTLLPIKAGIGRMACALSQKTDLAILPVAIWYRGRTPVVSGIAPDMYFGNLMYGPFDDRRAVTQDIAENLQACVDRAAAMASQTGA